MQLSGSYEIAFAWRGIAKHMATVKCASAGIVQAHGVEIVHVRNKRMLYPACTHHLKAVYSGDSKVFSEIP
jgi:hypothetical protein